MVIRYTCRKCKSVLKISVDLAGTDGKCPKCKVGFKVPEPLPEVDDAAADTSPPADADFSEPVGAEAELAAAIADLVDMPMEVTPMVDLSAMDEFGPMAVLESEMVASPKASGSSPPEAPKRSVAELMREHEEAKKKKSAAKKKDKGSLEGASAAADVMTAGTAASALTRTYDRKRSGGTDGAPLTRDERRKVEEREAAISYAKKAIPSLAAMAVVGYFLLSWAYSAALPDLEHVTGVVTRDQAPLAGVTVQFAPSAPGGGPPLENSTPSTGITNASGEYVMMYDPDNPGVLPGVHHVTISTVSGLVYPMPVEEQTKTVSSDSRTFNFNL